MFRVAQIILLLTATAGATLGQQEPQRPPDISPPPLKTISRADRSQIDDADNPKDRVKVTITLAETYLASAEQHSSQSDFAAASTAIGRYWALLEDVFGFMKTLKLDSNKTRDMYKRVEMTLRGHGPRLTAMRRSTPAEYSVWIKEIEEYARNGRTEALNSFYGHTVFREIKPTAKQDLVPPQKTSISSEAKKP